jgi:hypothetical protein
VVKDAVSIRGVNLVGSVELFDRGHQDSDVRESLQKREQNRPCARAYSSLGVHDAIVK